MKLSLGFSPCPNDTFMFDALIHHKIDTQGLEFEVRMADVEELNRSAFAGQLDITKLSFHAFAYAAGQYELLDSGSALGNNCGPLLIAKEPLEPAAVESARIAIPGRYTTANFLLGIAYPTARNKQAILFSDIEDAVLTGEYDAGLIIHENRFTYADKGLVRIVDLGEYWETLTGMPIPLGGIVVRQSLNPEVKQLVNRLIRESVDFAFSHPEASRDFVRQYAQEMDEKVIYQHIGLYVNDFSKDLGPTGKMAVRRLFSLARKRQIIPAGAVEKFLNP